LDDIAYALQWFGPLRRDEFVLDWHHFPVVPDRREWAFVNAYGGLARFDVSEAVMARMQATSDLVRSLAQTGQEPQRTWVADRDAAEIAWCATTAPGSSMTARRRSSYDVEPAAGGSHHPRERSSSETC
jgi:hypothetical protein